AVANKPAHKAKEPHVSVSRSQASLELPKERIHIALVGFMGAGKSAIGRLLSERTGRPLVDLDTIVCERNGNTTIAKIFHEFGEVGFRARERAALREVLLESTP